MYALLAQTGDAGGGASSLLSFLPLILIGAFVYFAMIRPQRKRQQAVQNMQKELSVGDDVVTIGGMHGRVDAIGENTVDLDVTGDGDVIMRFKRSSIAEIVTEDASTPDEDADQATESSE
jgi:preprotein translocase subunit YajC